MTKAAIQPQEQKTGDQVSNSLSQAVIEKIKEGGKIASLSSKERRAFLSKFQLKLDGKEEGLRKIYNENVQSFWSESEINFGPDHVHWRQLKTDYSNIPKEEIPETRRIRESMMSMLKIIFAFFSIGDNLILEPLGISLEGETPFETARMFYDFQRAIETEHAKVYQRLLNEVLTDDEREWAMNAIFDLKALQAKIEWAIRNLLNRESYAERLIAMSCFEGLMFSSSFAVIFWVKERFPGMFDGMVHSNDFISKDEWNHTRFGVKHYHDLIEEWPKATVSPTTILNIITDAVRVECAFASEVIKDPLPGMNDKKMHEYIYYLGDYLLGMYGLPRHYKVTENPFTFMENLGMQRKNNQFERKNAEYISSVPEADLDTVFDGDDDDIHGMR